MLPRIVHTVKRISTLRTHHIRVLPIAILMPHSSCNCRCVMCDIWKGNDVRKQLSAEDISGLLVSFRALGTRRVIMSGGEALLNRNFFDYCRLLRNAGIKVTLLSTGLTISRHVDEILREVDEVIVSLDGDEKTHDTIRNIPGAFSKMADGIRLLKARQPGFHISGRCVIHRHNYTNWIGIVNAAREIGLDSISFLPADVTSEAFNREVLWDAERQESVAVPKNELDSLAGTLEKLLADCHDEISRRFILEPPQKLRKIVQYYQAHHGLAPFPEKKCNAPWVSAVVEADGTVRPCFFHDRIGNIRNRPLHDLVNDPDQRSYRRDLDISTNETCKRCVCYLNLPVTAQVG